MGKFNLIGRRFGRLTVIEEAPSRKGRVMWRCICECGREINVEAYRLTSGNTKSCGCWAIESRAMRMTTHGMSSSRIYKIYTSMIERCKNERIREYKYYGGRGITVCDEWLGENGFMNFYNWAMTSGYRDDLTIDRIDANGDYRPENCRWTTMLIQNNNRRNNVVLECNGEKHTASEWSRITGINYDVILRRLALGWSEEKTLTSPVKRLNPRSTKLKLEHSGKIRTVAEWSEISGVPAPTIMRRINAGWEIGDAIMFSVENRKSYKSRKKLEATNE